MDVSTEDCVTFYTSNTIITVIFEINANEPLQSKMERKNQLRVIKFSCLLEWGQNGQGSPRNSCQPLFSLRWDPIRMFTSSLWTVVSLSYPGQTSQILTHSVF